MSTLPIDASPSVQVAPAIEPIKCLAMAIQNQMGLDDDHILLSMENFPLPDDTGIFVALAYGTETVVGNSNYSQLGADGSFQEVQDVAMLHGVEVDVLSFDSSARTRKEEVVQACASVYTQNLMEKYNMRIANTPTSFTLITDPEPAKQLNRFRLTIMVNALHRRISKSGYFDSLEPVVITEQA